MSEKQFTIIGAGLAGIAAAYHLGHDKCVIFEKKSHPFGHIHSEVINGFTWDEGPHISFTKNNYVKQLFEKATNGDFIEKNVQPINYLQGHWIEHPVQSNLYAVPEPLRTACLEDFLSMRKQLPSEFRPENYRQWLEAAFGLSLTDNFYETYTKKYWTLGSSKLHTKWIGSRVYYPDEKTVTEGYKNKTNVSTHYITRMRYPRHGGYKTFASDLIKNSDIQLGFDVEGIDLSKQTIFFKNRKSHRYHNLIVTMPLPEFVARSGAPSHILSAAENLMYSELYLVNVEVAHEAVRGESWLYVYDQDKYSTRINFTELLSPENAPSGMSGIQVEVYFSKNKKRSISESELCNTVVAELIDMGLIKSREFVRGSHLKHVPYANVIFDLFYEDNLNIVFEWLKGYGLVRESDDLDPITNWDVKLSKTEKLGTIILAGRFGQWKYFWTDDCVLRAAFIGNSFQPTPTQL